MISIHIGLSYKCNMNCKHCYVKEKEKVNISIKPEQFDILFMKLKQLGSFSITYTMGETLLYADFPIFAEKAKQNEFYQVLLSNGSLLQSDVDIKRLIDIGIKKVGISLDSSSRAKHDENRGYVGAYDKAINAIGLLVNNPEIDVQLLTTISEDNIDEVENILSLGYDLGVTDFSFLWMRKNGKLLPISDYQKYKNIMTTLILLHSSKKVKINIHDFRTNSILDELLRAEKISKESYREFLSMNHCHASEEMILISPSGDMFSCNFSGKPFANIFNTELSEIAKLALKHKCSCSE